MKHLQITPLILAAALAAPLSAQAPNPVQQRVQDTNREPEMRDGVPLFRAEVVARTTSAINYRHRGGSTTIDFAGTPLLPKANGEAKVESKQGYIEIEVEFDDVEPATRFGPEYLTYVMWAITPEGRATNLGEVLLNGNRSKLNVSTELQTFGLVVTAEPYFAVSQPSDVVVMENIIRDDTRGQFQVLDATYDLLKRGTYTALAGQTMAPRTLDKKVPLEVYEARNALELSRFAGADRYAADTYRKAQAQLATVETYLAKKEKKKTLVGAAREAVQTAEDARLIALQRQAEEKLAEERAAAATREAEERQRAATARLQAELEQARAAQEAE
ncbi:MAG: OmpA family protein, partial [Acidimicrobiia bacterium]|nr:OmpA family protein [Acidimicrobiia bacterium]